MLHSPLQPERHPIPSHQNRLFTARLGALNVHEQSAGGVTDDLRCVAFD